MTKPKDRWYHYYDGSRMSPERVAKALRHAADAVEISRIPRLSVHLTVAEPEPRAKKVKSKGPSK